MSAKIDSAAGELARNGYCVLRQALDPSTISALATDLAPSFAATPMCQGVFYGNRTRRFGALLRRSTHAEALVRHSAAVAIAERMLLPWCERIALNLTQAVEIHPGAPPQFPHRDQDMWGGPKGSLEYLVNVMWPIDPFTQANGGTRLWPGSHGDQDVADLPEDLAVVPDVAPGDALLFLGSTLHGGGRNRSAARPGLALDPAPLPEREIVPVAEDVIAASGVDFRIGGSRAFYVPSADFVQVPPQPAFFEQINYYRTCLHELTHATGHAKRLARDLTNGFGTEGYAREELIAELGSAFLCAALGIVPTVRHADYLASWLEVLREDNRAIFRAASQASKAADWLLARHRQAMDARAEGRIAA